MDRLGILAGLDLGFGISGFSLGSWEGRLFGHKGFYYVYRPCIDIALMVNLTLFQSLFRA